MATLGPLSDPVRVRVLFALVAVDELCVGDLALVLVLTLSEQMRSSPQTVRKKFRAGQFRSVTSNNLRLLFPQVRPHFLAPISDDQQRSKHPIFVPLQRLAAPSPPSA